MQTNNIIIALLSAIFMNHRNIEVQKQAHRNANPPNDSKFDVGSIIVLNVHIQNIIPRMPIMIAKVLI
jgi:hypothetical protein